MNRFTKNFLQDYDVLFAKEELISLIVPKWVEKYKIYDRKNIISRIIKGSFGIFIFIFGVILVIYELIFSLMPPFIDWSIIIFSHALLYFLLLMPFSSICYNKYVKKETIKMLRLIFLLVGLFYISLFLIPEKNLVKEKIRDQEEIRMLSNMTEEAREKYLKDKQENAARRAFVTENSEKIIAAQANTERRRREEEIEKEKLALRNRLREREKDVEMENKAQREYYSRMAAPKLIYKCNDSDREIAIAARIGNINRLLNEAEDKCSGRYEVIKRKD